MNKKIAFQLSLFLILLFVIFFFYYEYFFLKKERESLDITNKNQNIETIQSENNLIRKLEYLSIDKNGNRYLITSEFGEISNVDSNIMLMTNVMARIDLFKKDTIYLSSNSAKYNTLNFDTNFYKNVTLKYIGHDISSENLDLFFKKNFVWIYNNVIYKDSTNKLIADKIEIDLITKDSKIFMLDNKKLKIIGK
tara:strand:+ start:73 stop:654 length:582 start_codon:yes stop_codon:yes gene_type:complete